MPNQIIATSEGGQLTGTNSDDIMYGLDAWDWLIGLDGNDILYGGNGDDSLEGGHGDDMLYGDAGDDGLNSTGGNDSLFGGVGNDRLSAWRSGAPPGTIWMDGGSGADWISYSASDYYNSQVGNGDTGNFIGGDGNDNITIYSIITANIDSGTGNDSVAISLNSTDVSINLGYGQDILEPLGFYGPDFGNIIIEDFEVGLSGDRILFDRLLEQQLLFWDGSDPFISGVLSLVQSGTDTLVQINSQNLYTMPHQLSVMFTLRNVQATSLTQENLGFAPGSKAATYTLNGDASANNILGYGGDDTIYGFDGHDNIEGFTGNDDIYGGNGQDFLQGGVGDDNLYGGAGGDSLEDFAGNDSLYGEDGNDYLTVFHDLFDEKTAKILLLDGGNGDDIIRYGTNQYERDHVTIIGGSGNDQIYAGPAVTMHIDASDGDDVVNVEILGGDVSVSLGTGHDNLKLSQSLYATHGQISPVVVSGFDPGPSGDVLDISDVMASRVLNWDGTSNPFDTGHLRLLKSGADTLLQIDRTGGADDFSTVLNLLGVSADTITASELGWSPITVGSEGNDIFIGTYSLDRYFGDAGDDTLTGSFGDDVIDGGSGTDTAVYSVSRAQASVVHNADGSLTVDAGADGIDTLLGIERLQFSDGLYTTDQFINPSGVLVANFNPANGWTSQALYPRHVGDVNGDGYSDIVGFGHAGVLVSFGAADGSFSGASVVVSNFGQTAGWTTDNQYHRTLADVNGDGRDDIIGFGIAGTLVSLAKADGTFDNPFTGISDFGEFQGWASQDGFARAVGDVNGDGNADIIGFGYAGTLVALGNGNGTFQGVTTGVADFGVKQGWTSDDGLHRDLADVNGDGYDDIIGFGYAGTLVSLSNGDGSFAPVSLAVSDFGVNQGWASQDGFARDVADINDDGFADIVGFGIAGTLVAYGQSNGSFSAASLDLNDFGVNQGWLSDATFHRAIADIDNDGLNDIIGFGIAGVLVGLNQGDLLV